MIDVIYPSLLNHPTSKATKLYNFANSTYEINSVQGYSDLDSPIYLVSIPPGSGVIIEAIFPEEGFYFGNDHDLASLLYGSGFVVSAVDNHTSAIGK
jgi:hypothetical protein